MAVKTVVIKKYENRRLYDATNSRYVNLDDVARMLQHGDDVRVVDAATGDDITRIILTQIIAEGAKTPESTFPLEILRDMVIASGRASQESAVRYTRAMLDLYKNTYRAMSPALNPFDFMQASPGGQQTPPPPPEIVPEQDAAPAKNDRREVASLKERVAELEKMVSSIAAKKSPRKSPKPRTRSKLSKK